MAEATVDSPPNRFFCHACDREVQPNLPSYTCSRCDGGFIEEIVRPVPAEPPLSQNSDAAAQFAEMLQSAFFDPLRSAANQGTFSGARHRYNTRQAARSSGEDSAVLDLMDEDDLRGIAPSAMFHIHTGDTGQPGTQTFHGIINYVIQRLGTDLSRGSPLILHGNPGDYAWGAGGLDTVISQLLNHLENTGAPPAQKEKIDSLPRVIIDQSHVDATLQCSICMEDFEVATEVRKLPCDHMYHTECIVKWLEMHGTCPVCRKDLNGDDTSTRESGEFSPFFPPPAGGGPSSSSSSSSSSMGPSTSSSFSM
ncbi:E3 ubiquitin-protein ligase rnf115-like [Plakobranchus ocellatus]|uniref:RING-type E3 ubiquitin transferase n=1 Tax=Plakobranchus ocellatus TaxID=259542 RepID=A0AAV4DR15_9GAST|nr:E3 ubiquitin-protein ligase rnf115-like [Plakobranchus ocellatus]